MQTKTNIILWICRIVAAGIMLQTLYFKFTGHPDSIYIFSHLGVEPFGRIGAGVFELIASLLLLIPRTTFYGSVLGMGVMSGAIASHLFVLGIDINNDGGLLFFMALITFATCGIMVWVLKNKITRLFVKI